MSTLIGVFPIKINLPSHFHRYDHVHHNDLFANVDQDIAGVIPNYSSPDIALGCSGYDIPTAFKAVYLSQDAQTIVEVIFSQDSRFGVAVCVFAKVIAESTNILVPLKLLQLSNPEVTSLPDICRKIYWHRNGLVAQFPENEMIIPLCVGLMQAAEFVHDTRLELADSIHYHTCEYVRAHVPEVYYALVNGTFDIGPLNQIVTPVFACHLPPLQQGPSQDLMASTSGHFQHVFNEDNRMDVVIDALSQAYFTHFDVVAPLMGALEQLPDLLIGYQVHHAYENIIPVSATRAETDRVNIVAAMNYIAQTYCREFGRDPRSFYSVHQGSYVRVEKNYADDFTFTVCDMINYTTVVWYGSLTGLAMTTNGAGYLLRRD